jgi:hypothetical protein
MYLNSGKSESVERSINSRTTLFTIAVFPTPGTPLIYNALQKKAKQLVEEIGMWINFTLQLVHQVYL